MGAIAILPPNGERRPICSLAADQNRAIHQRGHTAAAKDLLPLIDLAGIGLALHHGAGHKIHRIDNSSGDQRNIEFRLRRAQPLAYPVLIRSVFAV